ncbi:conjugal transfer protein TraB [Methanobrevibacter sp. 87.7]|uniref:TraB/GumN family protein n=1 Tax=Methanobrevibacter sp. 87.7 TaxID=387957 RepID=UPI000B4FE0D3|nr:TraB/GumN family protein [Methanobrevibacter sp. 87.7]OWT33408.1 conjugal transfer protein TraB [Methanobrevibacter sp. 87.7]
MLLLNRENLTIIGTAHVSSDSVKEVKNTIYELQPEVVGVELDYGRFKRLMDEKNGVKSEDDVISMRKIIKENKVGLFFITSILSYFQNKIGQDVDVKPGSEMIAAIEAANDLDIKIALLDRDINITLERVLNKMSGWQKFKFILSALKSLFVGEDEEIDIEELKQEDTIEELMEYFKEVSPEVYQVLVHERDAYLAQSILNIPEDSVVAVVGAGHKEGINNYLDHPEEIPSYSELTSLDEKNGIPWMKIIIALIPILFIVIFFLAFINGVNINREIIDYFLIYIIAGFIGSICSGSKVQSAIVGGLSAPFTVMHPLLAAGMFSALVELHYRKVKKSDIKNLNKIESLKDLWHNNIFRILLVFIGTDIGVSIATFFILPTSVFIPLITKTFGI